MLILVYILSRSRGMRQTILPVAYFFFIACSFALVFALRLEDYETYIRLGLWFSWAMAPPLCYLLVIDTLTATSRVTSRVHYLPLLSPLLVIGVASVLRAMNHSCEGQAYFCSRYFDILYWLGSMAGALTMLLLWFQDGLFLGLWNIKGGHRERYWLVLMLVTVNVMFVVVSLLRSTGAIQAMDADAVMVTLGLAFVYLVTTVLFRVYPLPQLLETSARPAKLVELNAEELVLAEKVKGLMEREKLYQEPSFSRADLAQELKVSESVLSKVVNVTFGKSLPQLLNELRVEDAKRLLKDPKIPVQVVASEVGFNSVASFNRVFKEVTGESPSSYRSGTNA